MACSKESTRLDNEIRIALVGKTGVGKSATGNTISGQKAFMSRISGSSINETCKLFSFDNEGCNWRLIEVPGLFGTNMSEGQINLEVEKCISLSYPGLHAVLFVISCGSYTDEDIKTLDMFIQCFGKEAPNYVIVIFTRGDNLVAEGITVQDFIRSRHFTLQKFIDEVKNRFIVVNNRGSEEEKHQFRRNLSASVESMVRDNRCSLYTQGMYAAAKAKEMEKIKVEEASYEMRVNERVKEILREKERKEAIRRNREKIGKGVGATLGAVAGPTLLYLGLSVTGPVGAGLAMGASLAVSYVGKEIGGHIGRESI